MPTPREEMRIVARRLAPLNVPFAFVGGAVMCLLVDYSEVVNFRPTKDVDVIASALTYLEFAQLEEQLRQHGFQHDTSKGAPICRWIVDGCRVDIMPTQPANLGMNTRWFPEALHLSVFKDLGDDCRAKVIAPALFLATKLEAFKDRSKGDYYASHDLEDIITLVDGCAAIVQEVRATDVRVRTFVSEKFRELLAHRDFRDALPGHLAEKLRIPVVLKRFAAIAALE